MMIGRITTRQGSNRSTRPRQPLALGVSLAALVVATTGGAYAAAGAHSASIRACEHHGSGTLYMAHTCRRHDRSVNWNLTGPQGPQGLQGLPGRTGATGAPGPAGAAGPGAVMLHADTTTPFAERVLGKIGPWTIVAGCGIQAGDGIVQVQAAGPSDSVADGMQIDSAATVDSVWGSTMELGNDLDTTTGIGYNAVNLDLYSPSSGAAHISLYKYDQGPGSPGGFRCKINGSGYQTS